MPDRRIPALGDFALAQSRAPEQIAEVLQSAIVRGELEPGSRIRESAIAARIGVSRNTVREAVLMLRGAGLVEHEVNRGMVVRAIDVDAVEDLYRAREALELAGIGAVTPRTSLDSLRAGLARLDRAAHRGRVAELVQSDLAFHAALVGLLGSPRLDAYFAELGCELRYYLAALSAVEADADPVELVAEHAAILDALQARRAGAARRLVRAHLRGNRRDVVTLLRSSQAA